MHHLPTHVTEGGTEERVEPEPVRHVDLETLLQELWREQEGRREDEPSLDRT